MTLIPNTSRNRSREWGVSGHCVMGDETLYFKGKITAVSQRQAMYFVCCDIKQVFKATGMVYPEFYMCRTYDSSSWIERNNAPSPIKYYRDSERKTEIIVDRKEKELSEAEALLEKEIYDLI